MTANLELRISGQEVVVKLRRKTLARAPLASFVKAVAASGAGWPGRVLPGGVRRYEPRGSCVAVAVEIPPQSRRVRWIADDSEAPFGRRAKYRECFLSFPYVVILLVLRNGHPTGRQQLFYRRAPLDAGDEALLLPNLTNVARAYGMTAWLCLQHLRQPHASPELADTVRRVVDHTFNAAFNHSADIHEGHSYWAEMRDLDPRVASLDAWEAATRANRSFALEVSWKPSGLSAGAELGAMLDQVEHPLGARPDIEQLAGLVSRAAAMAGEAST